MEHQISNERIEADSLGERRLPKDALYGVNALRGAENFDISGRKIGQEQEYIEALAIIKRSAAQANREIGALKPNRADAIVAACDEILAGQHYENFIIDMLEGSGGTSINMNINEVIANRALQILGATPGAYEKLHPNDHVNMGQSTNDVLPSAVKLAVYFKSAKLQQALKLLADTLSAKAQETSDVLRLGRTCMQAAQPMTLGQAFGGYAAAISRAESKLALIRQDLLVLPMGGTAIGTGLGSYPGYRRNFYKYISAHLGFRIQPAADMFDGMQNSDTFARVSNEIKVGAEVISKIAADLVTLSSNAESAIGEINLPAVQPGSSIMPGKVNPVMPMMMQQVACAVFGNDAAVSLAALQGQLEINHFEPIIASRMFDSIDLLARSTTQFATDCIAGITANEEKSLQNLKNSSALATVFVPQLGYSKVSKLVKESVRQNRPFIDLLIENGLMTNDEVMAFLKKSTKYDAS